MTTLRPSWEPFLKPGSRARADQRHQAWQHNCDVSGQRIMSSDQVIDLGGCPFCGGYPPDVEFRDLRLTDGSYVPWTFVRGKPYPPPPTVQRDSHMRGGAAAMAAHLAEVKA